MNLSPLPIQKFFDNAGAPLSGGKLFTYVAATTTKIATYTDSTGGTPNTNPVLLNYRGEANVWLDPTLTYKFVLAPSTDTDPPTNPIWSVDNISTALSYANLIALITQTFIGLIFYPRSPAEIAAGVVPVNYFNFYGNVLRYGTNTTPGTTDMTTAINNALASNDLVYLPAGTYFCSAALNLISGQTFYGEGSASILKFTNDALNNILGSGISNTVVRDLKINVTGTGGTTGFAGIMFANGCVNCKAERVEIAGVNFDGVWIKGSSKCTVRACYFHDFLGANANADVMVTNDGNGVNLCDSNIVDGNQCFGGGLFGVIFQQFYTTDTITPRYNIVCNNRIGQHSAYGILMYNVLTQADCYNQALGNYVENIQGTALANTAGAAIYSIEQGGNSFIGNVIRTCCVSTNNNSLVPAGIAMGGNTGAPYVCTGNTINDVKNFYGIEMSGCPTGGTISGNTINFQAGTPLVGIYINGCSNVTLDGNTINILNTIATTFGIEIFANGVDCSNISINGGVITGTSSGGILTTQSGGFNIRNLTVNGVVIGGGGAAAVPLSLLSVVRGSVAGCICSANTTTALSVSGSTAMRYVNSNYTTTGTVAVVLAGTNSGSYFDKSNLVNGNLQNTGTGCINEQLGSATPAAGNNSAVGDRIEQSVPVVGNPKGWRCTVAGNPGTWVSEGNL